jgi:hypothetical protein
MIIYIEKDTSNIVAKRNDTKIPKFTFEITTLEISEVTDEVLSATNCDIATDGSYVLTTVTPIVEEGAL